MYQDEKAKNTHVIRTRFNDYVYDELLDLAESEQMQLGVLIRQIIVETLHNPELLETLTKNNKG